LGFAAISDYAGVYSGILSGDDNGLWVGNVEPTGRTTVYFYSTIYHEMDGIEGYYINSSGNLMATTFVNGAALNITFNTGGSVYGTWRSSDYYASGTISGSIQTNNSKYAGTYVGTIAGADSKS